jgi:hypothetical protein
VVRRGVSVSGEVTGIHPSSLPGGLTESDRRVADSFRPGDENGQPVSCYMQLEYNFNLY